jgi:spermidine synthase
MSATNPHSQRYMRLFAYLPLAFRGGPKDVLLICYGCGVTADAFLRSESVRRLDAVDISKEVFALADFYSGINYSNPLRDPRVHAIVQDGRFFLQACPRQYDIVSGEPPPPKVAGSVNLYTQEFFSLMKGRLKEGGIATFWLPLNQLKLEESKAILHAFRAVFPTCAVWAAPDQEWIMMGIKGSPAKVRSEEITRLWADPRTGADLRRIGLEVPEQLGALYIMDGEEIDRITDETAPLIDNYPKRLTDERWDEEANHRLALSCFDPATAMARFRGSALTRTIWPETLNRSLESLFAVRQARYVSETSAGNKLDELDLYLRHSRLRTPILEILGSDGFRLGIAERVAGKSDPPPIETLPDLIAGALAARDLTGAIGFLEMKNERSAISADDLLLLIYLYCLNERVDKAEALANTNVSYLAKASSVDWLWHKLQADFGFHPPE